MDEDFRFDELIDYAFELRPDWMYWDLYKNLFSCQRPDFSCEYHPGGTFLKIDGKIGPQQLSQLNRWIIKCENKYYELFSETGLKDNV